MRPLLVSYVYYFSLLTFKVSFIKSFLCR